MYVYKCIYHQRGSKNYIFSLTLLTIIKYQLHTALLYIPVGNTE